VQFKFQESGKVPRRAINSESKVPFGVGGQHW